MRCWLELEIKLINSKQDEGGAVTVRKNKFQRPSTPFGARGACFGRVRSCIQRETSRSPPGYYELPKCWVQRWQAETSNSRPQTPGHWGRLEDLATSPLRTLQVPSGLVSVSFRNRTLLPMYAGICIVSFLSCLPRYLPICLPAASSAPFAPDLLSPTTIHT